MAIYSVNSDREVCFGFGNETNPLVWHVGNRENRVGRACQRARAAINTLVWVNKELIVSLVDTIDWTDFDARTVFDADAGLGNHRE